MGKATNCQETFRLDGQGGQGSSRRRRADVSDQTDMVEVAEKELPDVEIQGRGQSGTGLIRG